MTTPISPIESAPMTPEDFDELEAILDDLRAREGEAPQWEYCEGFMAALICCRRLILPSEYLPALLGRDGTAEPRFADMPQAERFMTLWMRRWNEVAQALNDQAVEALDDERCYHPEVMDARGALAALSPEERAALSDESVPSFAQLWALGFMDAVERWPEEWAPPRDKESTQIVGDALDAIVALTEDDQDEPALSPFDEDGPHSLSVQRLEAFGEAIWAVYELRDLWRNMGPRVETVRKEATPGRNDLCYCGSGKKYKKCHGAH